MTLLATRTREAIKTALAMTIAFGIALAMDWDRPYWAGFAVAFISLPGIGQSLRKGSLRMAGTLVATVAAVVIVGLFPQERWWLLVAFSIWIGLCAYMMQGGRHPYFWQVSGFVCAIIVFDGGVNATNLFQTAVERGLETGMGILVYTLVSVFLWPMSTKMDLDGVSRRLASTLAQLFQSYRTEMASAEAPPDPAPLRMAAVQFSSHLAQTLDGAEADSYEVWEVRHQWRRFARLSADFGEALEGWRATFPEIRHLALASILPNLDDVCNEVTARLQQIERMLAGAVPDRTPSAITVALDEDALRALSHFHKAAIATTKAQLDRLERMSRDLFACAADISGQGIRMAKVPVGNPVPRRVTVDTERVIGVVRVLAGVWMAYLIWIFMNPPGHQAFIIFPVSLGLGFALMPWIPVAVTWGPILLSAAFASILYVFVMPQLSGYWELGTMIFTVTFAICYLFSEPRQGLARAAGLALFIVFTGVSNEQTYSFAGLANQLAMIVLAIALLTASAFIPVSPLPEKRLLRFFRRFFRHSEYQMSRMSLDWKRERGMAGRIEPVLYDGDLLALARQMEPWGRAIDPRAVPDATPEMVEDLVISLETVALRFRQLREARTYPQADVLVRELLSDVRAWRIALQEVFKRWADDPAVASVDDLRERLASKLETMERRIDEVFDLEDARGLKRADYENFYRLLGAYRGLSEAVVVHAGLASRVHWAQWREARF